ncbi:TPA: protein-glutamate O-methyltransferase CheR, partial [Pseudomonas aeruginosa]
MNDRFERLLKSRIGLDASSVGSAVIERAVRQRMSGLALHDEDEYWMRLNGSPGEVQALIEAVVVPETWFFRYPESFTTLARLAFERLPSLGGGRALRILSLPCSTGEEPYSIVMALLDAGLSEYLFEVDALDVSARVIERASLGVYGRNSFRGDELGFRDRHFSEVADGYQLAEQVRRKVRFRCGNLLDPGLLAGEAPYDFVFCRNLLIYFDRPTQSEVVEVLKRLLRSDGAMFIGPAEASLLSQHGMQPIGVPLSFVFRRTSEAPRGARPKAVSDGARPVVTAAVERASIRPSPPPPAKPRQRLSSLVPPASGQPLASPVGEFD